MKTNVKKTKSLRLGISEDEKVTLGKEKIDQVGSFTLVVFGSITLVVLLVKTVGAVEMLKVEYPGLRVFFHS